MGGFPAKLSVRGVALACCLAAVVFVAPGAAFAAIQGSRHDFQAGPFPNALAATGSCSSCHIPHNGRDPRRLWVRTLTGTGQESVFYTQTLNPDYLPSATLLCYDCHDDALSSETTPDPAISIWPLANRPQDIALGTPAKVGYYEKYDKTVPGVGNPAPTDGSPTGGHYWKSEPTSTPDYKRGDKLRCDFCHDPHNARTGTNEAMFLTSTTNMAGGTITLGNGLKASNKDDLTNPNRSRYGTGTGREMCAACHGYSNSGAPVTIANVLLPRPTTTMPQHRLIDTTPCTKCHAHNKIYISCRECHGYPPLLTAAQAGGTFDKNLRPDAENYTNGAGAHQRHKDALGEAIFSCEICHGPDAGSATWHNEGNGPVLQANVNVMGQTDFWGSAAGVGYTGVPGGTLQAGYSFAAKGANDGGPGNGGRCASLTCHGNPPDVALGLNWTDTMVDGDTLTVAGVAVNEAGTGSFVGADGENVCLWCHDGTPARIGLTGITAPNVLGNGTTWGAKVNGHGLAATAKYDRDVAGEAPALGKNGAGKNCVVCHDARYRVNGTPPPANIPYKTHFDGANNSAQKRLNNGVDSKQINGQSPATADAVCTSCHQVVAADSGTQVSHHGNDSSGGYQPREAPFSRACAQCHDVHGANWNGSGRNLYMVGSWVDANNNGIAEVGEEARVDSNAASAVKNIDATDRAVVFTSRTGANSFDEVDTAGTQDADDICATCHAPATGGGGGTGGGLHDGLTSPFDMRGQDCTQCHDHDFDNVAASPPDGWMPSGCEGCHGGTLKLGNKGFVHMGADGVPCTIDDAPNVTTVHVGAAWLSVWEGEWWDTTQTDSTRQQGGHGDPDGKEGGDPLNPALPTCLSCHSTSLPAGTHFNGVYNSVGTELPRGSINWSPQDCSPSTPRPKANANTNTSHLLAPYFSGASGNTSSWQVTMDNYCFNQCHAGNAVQDMRHERDTQPPDAEHHSVQMGTHLTRTAPLSYVDDDDLATGAAGLPVYAPCVACHNPHGSTNTDTKASGVNATNRMIIGDFNRGSALCANCHQ